MITLAGTIQRVQMGPGTWTLTTADGSTYELHANLPEALQQPGLSVRLQGRLRDDVMTLAMVGPVFEITDYEILCS
ncbi:hypothetical protein XM38_052340 [Halomicronema hongdechloris C2206]|uniref:Uncharacterized protein n=1 Tax=Halomicronema hongdechloris C2206 TaxID=1641165 RepID=A0A1Z3HVD6_9CYAN|nr:hypothetical protein [Halomicronema hongdechloris]ASC74259.1 hypothetical protein XM38_052340 [Halomicronema hongdechloris C2206]